MTLTGVVCRGVAWGLIMSGANAVAIAGAFNPPAGRGVAILSGAFTDGRDFVDGAGRAWRAPGFRKFETQAHVEFGLTDWLALVARPRIVSIHQQGRKGFSESGFGASEIGAQVRLLQSGEWVFAAQALARTPASPGGRFTDWEDGGGVEGRLMAARSFTVFGAPGYLDMQIGARTRKGRADEIASEHTFGLRPIPRLLVTIQTFTQRSLESARRRIRRGAPLGEWRVKAQIGAVYDVTSRLSLGAALFRTLAARDGAWETGVTVSIWRRF